MDRELVPRAKAKAEYLQGREQAFEECLDNQPVTRQMIRLLCDEDIPALCEALEAQERRIEELKAGRDRYRELVHHWYEPRLYKALAELQKKSEFLRATARTLFSERRNQEDTAIRWVLDKDGFIPTRNS